MSGEEEGEGLEDTNPRVDLGHLINKSDHNQRGRRGHLDDLLPCCCLRHFYFPVIEHLFSTLSSRKLQNYSRNRLIVFLSCNKPDFSFMRSINQSRLPWSFIGQRVQTSAKQHEIHRRQVTGSRLCHQAVTHCKK